MMKGTIGYGLVVLLASTVMGIDSRAASLQSNAEAVLANALAGTHVSLGQGLRASVSAGRPISGKFEMEDGKLQLSVYTSNKGKYSEVIVDYKSGKIAKSEEIKEGEDLSHATAQNKAMVKAKRSLRAATDKAVASNKGYRAVSAVPSLEQDKPVATIVLENATGTKTVSEKLD